MVQPDEHYRGGMSPRREGVDSARGEYEKREGGEEDAADDAEDSGEEENKAESPRRRHSAAFAEDQDLSELAELCAGESMLGRRSNQAFKFDDFMARASQLSLSPNRPAPAPRQAGQGHNQGYGQGQGQGQQGNEDSQKRQRSRLTKPSQGVAAKKRLSVAIPEDLKKSPYYAHYLKGLAEQQRREHEETQQLKEAWLQGKAAAAKEKENKGRRGDGKR